MPATYLTDAMIEDAMRTIRTAHTRHAGALVALTGFGIHSALILHLASLAVPGLAVIWVDTGYLPEETHIFAYKLMERFDLDFHIARAELTPTEMEARHGRLWQTGNAEDLALYHRISKTAPMKRALKSLGAEATLAGLRRDHARNRKSLEPVSKQWGRTKYLPLLDWSDQVAMTYINRHDLPLHPLFFHGYRTVGDAHSSWPARQDENVRETRFGGMN